MGDIADAILEGLFDEETGEYIGDENMARFGTKSPGFPVSYQRGDFVSKSKQNRTKRNAAKGLHNYLSKRIDNYSPADLPKYLWGFAKSMGIKQSDTPQLVQDNFNEWVEFLKSKRYIK